MKKWNYCIPAAILLSILLLQGCGSASFMKKEQIAALKYNETNKNQTIYFNKKYSIESDGSLIMRHHTIVKIGNNPGRTPDMLVVYDSPTLKLLSYNARTIKPDGDIQTYGSGDLGSVNLSSGRQISKSKIKIAPFEYSLEEGDIIEVLYESELSLPQLGIYFSKSEAGENAHNISFNIEAPSTEKILYQVYFDDQTPQITEKEGKKTYKFTWERTGSYTTASEFECRNQAPKVVVTSPLLQQISKDQKPSWKAFGSWYLNAISDKSDTPEMVKDIADSVTAGLDTNLEKMEAIFKYCTENYRYEQHYLEYGEVIPNKVSDIIKHKYGDCKDYSFLMYELANSVGIPAKLALCHRGRGRFHPVKMPVSQFNHCILALEDNGQYYWYDGTNQTGMGGITLDDLINQYALVIDEESSKMELIKEHPGSGIDIYAEMTMSGKNLKGVVSFALQYQYGIMFSYIEKYLNKNDFLEMLGRWIKNNIDDQIIINNIKTSGTDSSYTITTSCEFPNVITKINGKCYFKPANIVKNILPFRYKNSDPDEIFYNPYFSRVNIDINLRNGLVSGNDHIRYKYYLPPGPFKDEERKLFLDNFNKTKDKLEKSIIISPRDI